MNRRRFYGRLWAYCLFALCFGVIPSISSTCTPEELASVEADDTRLLREIAQLKKVLQGLPANDPRRAEIQAEIGLKTEQWQGDEQFLAACGVTPGTESKDVLTQRNNNKRTGAYYAEKDLTPSTVNSLRFGKRFTLAVDGQIYAQPLYVANLATRNVMTGQRETHNVVFVATMNNSLYAFDADGGNQHQPLWTINFGTAVRPDDVFQSLKDRQGALISGYYPTISPKIGITSTPVIDRGAGGGGRLYLVTKTAQQSSQEIATECNLRSRYRVRHRLIEVDIGGGAQTRSVDIDASAPGNGYCADNGMVKLDHVTHLNRPGLLRQSITSQIYVAFGSHRDNLHHGWIIAYDQLTLRQVGVFVTTPNSGRGAVWQAGTGLAADDTGNVYFMTGDGPHERILGTLDNRELSNSFIKLQSLSNGLSLADWFTPYNQDCLEKCDLDLGAAGVVLVDNRVVGGGKEGKVYVLDQNNLGKFNTQCDRATLCQPNSCQDKLVQSFKATQDQYGKRELVCRPENDKTSQTPFSGRGNFEPDWDRVDNSYSHIHGTPVVWSQSTEKMMYLWGEEDVLKAYAYDSGSGTFRNPGSPFTGNYRAAKDPNAGYHGTMPGGILSLSANLYTNGVIWASRPVLEDGEAKIVDGMLEAYDATPTMDPLHPLRKMLRRLWSSEDSPDDKVGFFAKFVPPTIANGRVYLATFGDDPGCNQPQHRPDGCGKLVVFGLR